MDLKLANSELQRTYLSNSEELKTALGIPSDEIIVSTFFDNVNVVIKTVRKNGTNEDLEALKQQQIDEQLAKVV